jgi:hypothetical protein
VLYRRIPGKVFCEAFGPAGRRPPAKRLFSARCSSKEALQKMSYPNQFLSGEASRETCYTWAQCCTINNRNNRRRWRRLTPPRKARALLPCCYRVSTLHFLGSFTAYQRDSVVYKSLIRVNRSGKSEGRVLRTTGMIFAGATVRALRGGVTPLGKAFALVDRGACWLQSERKNSINNRATLTWARHPRVT